MNRNAAKLLGIFMLVLFGFMTSTPFLAAHTKFYDNPRNIDFKVGNITLMSVTHSVNGTAIGTASMLTAVLTLVGIVLLVGVYTFAPVRRSRHVITHRS